MPLEHETDTALALAVRKAGSQSAFARVVGKSQSTVNDWLRTGKDLPAELVLTVEGKLGLGRHQLRPDIYPLAHTIAPCCDMVKGAEPIRNPIGRQMDEIRDETTA